MKIMTLSLPELLTVELLNRLPNQESQTGSSTAACDAVIHRTQLEVPARVPARLPAKVPARVPAKKERKKVSTQE